SFRTALIMLPRTSICRSNSYLSRSGVPGFPMSLSFIWSSVIIFIFFFFASIILFIAQNILLLFSLLSQFLLLGLYLPFLLFRVLIAQVFRICQFYPKMQKVDIERLDITF